MWFTCKPHGKDSSRCKGIYLLVRNLFNTNAVTVIQGWNYICKGSFNPSVLYNLTASTNQISPESIYWICLVTTLWLKEVDAVTLRLLLTININTKHNLFPSHVRILLRYVSHQKGWARGWGKERIEKWIYKFEARYMSAKAACLECYSPVLRTFAPISLLLTWSNWVTQDDEYCFPQFHGC